jgi:TRAP-type C4-dicarboxylate transport system substrate-binding protein
LRVRGAAFSLLTACALVLTSSLALHAAPAHAAVLKIATLSPDGSGWMNEMRGAAKEIAEATAGRVTLKLYPGGVMGDDKAVLRKIRLGQLQGAALTGGSLTGSFTDVQLYNLPMIFEDLGEVDYVRSRMDAYIIDGLAANGYTALGIAEVGFAYAMSNVAETSVESARRQKVWVPDGDPGSVRTAEAFGIAPVPLTIADVLAGLQTGLINAVAMPPVGAVALQWHTQLRYLVDLPLMYVYGTFVLSNKSFEALDEADRKVVSEVLGRRLTAVDRMNRADHEAAFSALTKQGIEVLHPSPEETAVWRQSAAAAVERLVAESVVSRDAYDRMMALLAEYRAKPAQ